MWCGGRYLATLLSSALHCSALKGQPTYLPTYPPAHQPLSRPLDSIQSIHALVHSLLFCASIYVCVPCSPPSVLNASKAKRACASWNRTLGHFNTPSPAVFICTINMLQFFYCLLSVVSHTYAPARVECDGMGWHGMGVPCGLFTCTVEYRT
ncbi:hypothetical protein BKA80DRAFT_135329 [Phyllosticta citrichinensis]